MPLRVSATLVDRSLLSRYNFRDVHNIEIVSRFFIITIE